MSGTSKIKIKKSSVQGKEPLPEDLDYGELAINYTDGKLFYKSSANRIVTLLGAAPNVDGGNASNMQQEIIVIDGGGAA